MFENRIVLAVPVFLILQAGLVHWASGGERLPPKPDLERFPTQIGPWQKIREDYVDPEVKAVLRADSLLSWGYYEPKSALASDLFVAWFQSQRGGASQPHSPQVCLPGSGWTFETSAVATLETPEGPVPINQEIISQGKQRAALLYWYQTPRHVIASEWMAKFWVVADAIRDKRTDTSMVRVIVWNADRTDAQTTAAAMGFAQQAFPRLRTVLPR